MRAPHVPGSPTLRHPIPPPGALRVSGDRTPVIASRRPLASRSSRWARVLTDVLLRAGASPNAISVASIVCAALGAWLLAFQSHWLTFLAVAACIQLRLLCNLLDGMVAVEGGRGSPVGSLYNEVPDRIADSLLIIALGYAIDRAWLGWFGALAAALTAYVRVLGGSLRLAQDFRGPMAKQQRMAVLTIACVLAALETPLRGTRWALAAAAWIIAAGALLTCGTRLRAIARALHMR
jgi:phosphatidylglycerophosphate synthase